jgi:predicted transcriptional regulator
MSKLVAIRLPDELAARIYELAKTESMSQTAVIVKGLWVALFPPCIQAESLSPEEIESIQNAIEVPGKVKLLYPVKAPIKLETGHNRGGKTEASRALVRAQKKVFGPSRIEAALPTLIAMEKCLSQKPLLPHAPGCKCLMCQGK